MTPKRIAIIGSPGRVEDALRKPIQTLIDQVGQNTGNLAFWHAIYKQVAGEKTYFDWDFDPVTIRNEFDIVIFAAANQMNPRWDLGELARRLEATKKPLVVIGLGAQANKLGDTVTLQPGTQRLISLFSERCVRIGVRGEFSASVAEKYGAKNTEIIGCPSNFINTWETNLGAVISNRLTHTTKPYRIIVNLDLNAHLSSTIRRCVSWIEEWGGNLMIQTSASPMHLAFGQIENVPHNELSNLAHLLFDRAWDEKARQFLLSRLTVFFDAEAWMNAVRPSRLSIGTRLHGNILAFQAGVPSIVIPHDARTMELAQTIGIPTATHQQILETESLPSLMSNIEFDGPAFDVRRKALARRYVDLLSASEVPVAADLLALAASGEARERSPAPVELEA